MLPVIFKNVFFIVIHKPALMLSVPSRMGTDDKRPCAGLILQDEIKKKIFPIHRLDEPVSGLLMFALTPQAHRAANGWFEHSRIKKTYRAWSHLPHNHQFKVNDLMEWKCQLAKGKKRAYIHEKIGKQSVTLAKLIKVEENLGLWELNPVTGRSHQLRFEMARHDSPIVGDTLYGAPNEKALQGILLQCFCLDFSECEEAKDLGLPKTLELKEDSFSQPPDQKSRP